MSRTEKHVGRVQILTKTTKDTLEYLDKNPIDGISVEQDGSGNVINWDSDNDGYLLMKNHNSGEMCLLKMIHHKELDEYEDINYKQHNPDQTISFIVEYYNGGCGFYEALGDLLEEELKPQ